MPRHDASFSSIVDVARSKDALTVWARDMPQTPSRSWAEEGELHLIYVSSTI